MSRFLSLFHDSFFDRFDRLFDRFDGFFNDYETYYSRNGDKLVFVNGLLTAKVLTDGTIEYYKQGRLHRDNGPAIERKDGKHEYWLDGKKVTKEDQDEIIKKIEEEKKTPYNLELTKAEKEKIEAALGRKL